MIALAWTTAVLLCLGPMPDGPEPVTVTVRGRVVTLPEAIGPFAVPESQGPIADQVVLVGEDGAITPLLFTVGGRALFEDDRLRDRSAELTARRYEGLPYLQVLNFRVADDEGVLRTPEYYCDVCTITTPYDQPCPCCQGPMELRYRPGE